MKNLKNILFKFYKIQILLLLLFPGLEMVSSQTVTPWITSADQTKLLEKQSTVEIGGNTVQASVNVTVDPATTYQNIDGFGFCLTEGSAEVITSLNSTQQASLLSELFDTTNGLGISVLRIGIGATDLSSSDYSYDDVSGNASLTSFSLSGPDLTYLLPVLKKILAINPTIKILATPWSAPKWMKTNTSWVGDALQASFYSTYANYFIKYFDAMKAQGINIWAITPQNEPENAGNEPSMLMNSTDETNFINLYLGPAMASNGYSGIKIIAYDHNCNDTTYPIDVCNNSTYVDGAAFHLYAGDISALTTVKNATGKNVYFTEQYTAGTGSFSGDFPWHIQNVVIGSLNNSAKAVLEWNLASNSSFGPRTSGGCSSCQGAITITGSATFTRNVSYYIIGQISKFVKAGAVRIKASTTTAGYLSCGFKNPDGTLAVMAFNNKSTSQVYKFLVGIQAFTYTIPANSAATFTWNPNFSAIPETQINKLIISPNPVRNFIDLKSFDAEVNINSVEIISMNGEVMFNQSLPSGFQTKRIDISDLSSGIYTIRLKGNVGYTYSRFIKE